MHAPGSIRNTPALEVRGLAKAYRRGFLGRRGRPAVDDLSLTVERGEVFALLGHNGAGKTTTLKAVLGLVRPDRGSVAIGGVDAARPESRLGVGYLPESPTFHENLTAHELLDFYGRLFGLDAPERRRQSAECLARVGMDSFADRRLSACSKGMRQRIGLAQALLGDPHLLILDEPQSGLDPLGRRMVRDLLAELKREGRTIVFSSHVVPDVAAVADRVATLRGGRLVDLRDLRRRPAASGFRAVLAAPPSPSPLEGLLDDPGVRIEQRGVDRWTLQIASAASLAAVLRACADGGIAVYDLDAQAGDLEDAVLAELTDDGIETAEVVPC